jgi:hypothetical protein
MADVIPPDNRAAGQTGHIGDHNNISDVLTAFQAQLGGTPGFQMGSAPLVAGTVTVPNTSIASGWGIFLSRQTVSGTPGFLTWSINPGVSFTITSSSGSDAGTVWFLLVT